MQISYDKGANAAYISIRDLIVDRTIEIDPGTLVDVDNAGRIIGIELIRPARDWPLDDIAQRFDLDEQSIAEIRRLWPNGNHGRYPFAEPLEATA